MFTIHSGAAFGWSVTKAAHRPRMRLRMAPGARTLHAGRGGSCRRHGDSHIGPHTTCLQANSVKHQLRHPVKDQSSQDAQIEPRAQQMPSSDPIWHHRSERSGPDIGQLFWGEMIVSRVAPGARLSNDKRECHTCTGAVRVKHHLDRDTPRRIAAGPAWAEYLYGIKRRQLRRPLAALASRLRLGGAARQELRALNRMKALASVPTSSARSGRPR